MMMKCLGSKTGGKTVESGEKENEGDLTEALKYIKSCRKEEAEVRM